MVFQSFRRKIFFRVFQEKMFRRFPRKNIFPRVSNKKDLKLRKIAFPEVLKRKNIFPTLAIAMVTKASKTIAGCHKPRQPKGHKPTQPFCDFLEYFCQLLASNDFTWSTAPMEFCDFSLIWRLRNIHRSSPTYFTTWKMISAFWWNVCWSEQFALLIFLSFFSSLFEKICFGFTHIKR